MLNLSLLAMILIPVLVYWLSRKPSIGNEILPDYIVAPDVDVRPCITHWGIPVGVTRVNRALLSEVRCHPDFVERDVPEAWFKWNPADARKRARARVSHDVANGVLAIRRHA
jgi:hypothetical protein